MAKSGDYYYDSFVRLMEFPLQGAKMLDEILHSLNEGDIHEKLLNVHEVEHNGDTAKHEVTSRLVAEFITPIEREDILLLINKIDDVMDSVEDVVRLLSMYHVQKVNCDAFDFVPIIEESCSYLKAAIIEFKNFRKSKTIHQNLAQVNELEERGDRIHYQAIRRLHKESTDPYEKFIWTNIFEALEDCCDACKEVSEVIETVIMKNS